MHKHKVPTLPLAVVIFFIIAGLLHTMLCQQWAYDMVKGEVKTYAVERSNDGSWTAWQEEKAFSEITNERLVVWDASHYNSIKEYLYHNPNDILHCEYAFFPLFPLLWRTMQLPATGICILNIILFAIGYAILGLLFMGKKPAWIPLLALCVPYLVIFAIPYSEALFFLTCTVGLYGLVNRRYWLYFVGFMLASMTRSASNILLAAWIITDGLTCLQSRDNWKTFLRNVALHLAPVVTGVAAVMLIQWLCGATHPFQFITSQGVWEKEISLPSWPFTDWSVEGKSVTWPLIFTLFIPALTWLAVKLFCAIKQPSGQTTKQSDNHALAQCRLLSVLFFVGNIVLALFTQKGCMYSQARLLTCTPFFFFLLFDIGGTPIPKVWRWIVGSFLVIATIYCKDMLLGADTLGCLITLLLIVLVFYHHWMPRWLRAPLLGATLAMNIFWTAYLFNCFLNGGWIFT